MEQGHFWYRGRYRFLLHAVRRLVDRLGRRRQTPNRIINGALSAVFYAESPLGHYWSFLWGTSILAVLQKPYGAPRI
jgi:hypothetical protein